MQAVQPAIGWASVNEPGQLAAKSTVLHRDQATTVGPALTSRTPGAMTNP